MYESSDVTSLGSIVITVSRAWAMRANALPMRRPCPRLAVSQSVVDVMRPRATALASLAFFSSSMMGSSVSTTQ